MRLAESIFKLNWSNLEYIVAILKRNCCINYLGTASYHDDIWYSLFSESNHYPEFQAKTCNSLFLKCLRNHFSFKEQLYIVYWIHFWHFSSVLQSLIQQLAKFALQFSTLYYKFGSVIAYYQNKLGNHAYSKTNLKSTITLLRMNHPTVLMYIRTL